MVQNRYRQTIWIMRTYDKAKKQPKWQHLKIEYKFQEQF